MAKPIVAFVGVLSLLLLIHDGGAYQFMVGGTGDWSLASTSYNQWAEQSRFQIGDTILFNYEEGKDSVVQVTKDDYDNCNPASPIAMYSDGHSLVKFQRSGPHYFISGLIQNCKNNQKIVMVVMADRTHHSPPPSPAPIGQDSPPPPPPAPSIEDYNPNAAISIVISFAYSIVACVSSSLVFVY